MNDRRFVTWFVTWLLFLARLPTPTGAVRTVVEWFARGDVSEDLRARVFRRNFSDIYGLLTFVAAIATLHYSPYALPYWWLCYRTYEIVIGQACVVFGTDTVVFGRQLGVSGERVLLFGLINYAEAVVLFALTLMVRHSDFLPPLLANGTPVVHDGLASSTNALYFSLVTFATVGYGDFTPGNEAGAGLLVRGIATGLFLALVVIGRFLALVKAP